MQGDSEPTTLSEGERRILATIEAEFHLRDPGFAARYRRQLVGGGRRLTLFAIGAVVAGAVLMVATFATSLLLGAVGAALMGIGGAAGAPPAAVALRRLDRLLGWSVDHNEAGRGPGLRDDTP
jgi:hypothetical protein